MDKNYTLNQNFLIFGIPLGLLAILVLLMNSSFIIGNTTLNHAISIDLLLTVPLVYLFLIRKTKIPKTTVVPVMVLGLLVGSYFLPKNDQTYLTFFKNWILPLVEFFVIGYVIFKVRSIIHAYKSLKGYSPDFFDTLKGACQEILPQKLAPILVTEIAVIYYGFIRWKSITLSENQFTYHKKTGTVTLMIAFILIIGIESYTVHILAAKWSFIFAWILTGLSIYTAIQILGIAKSLTQRPISIMENHIQFRYGILNEVKVDILDINHIELSKKSLPEHQLTQSLSPISEMEDHNTVIYLSKEYELKGLYGIKKSFSTLCLHLDEPEAFKKYLESKTGVM